MLDRLTAADFAPLVDRTFACQVAGSTVELQLGSATELGPLRAGQPRAAFSLVFWGPPALPQGMYRVHHPTLGALDIFMVPIGPDARGPRYEAIFN
jgi:hypothetical protein